MPLEPTPNTPPRKKIDETTEEQTEAVAPERKETGSTFVQRPTPQATELSSGQSIHDLAEPTADVKTRVHAPSTHISAEWVYALVEDGRSSDSAAGGISAGEPKEVQISGTKIPERSSEQTDPYQETIVTKSVKIPSIPELQEVAPVPAALSDVSKSTAVDRSDLVESATTRSSSFEPIRMTSTTAESHSTPVPSPTEGETIDRTTLSTKIETEEEICAEQRKDHSPVDRQKRSTPQERIYVVSYQGSWLGTYRSSKRIQNKTAYLRVAEQLAAEIDQFDPHQLKLFKLTEVVLKQPIEFVGPQGYQAFSGGGPALLQD